MALSCLGSRTDSLSLTAPRRGLAINHRRPTIASRLPSVRARARPRPVVCLVSLWARRATTRRWRRNFRPSGLINFSCPFLPRPSSSGAGSMEQNMQRDREGRGDTTSERSSLPFAGARRGAVRRLLISTPKAKNKGEGGMEIRVDTVQPVSVSLSLLPPRRLQPTELSGTVTMRRRSFFSILNACL